MEGSSMEVAKVCKKMHRRVFDGENIDLIQVMKDVDENFALIYKATVSQYENLDRKFQIYNYYPDVFELRKALGFFVPPFRCLLKRCVEEGGAMDRTLIEILTSVESYFVELHEFCTTQLSHEVMGYVQWKGLEIKVRGFAKGNVMPSLLIKAFTAVFSVDSSPPSTSFINNNESMVELLNQVLENLNEFEMEDKNIKTSIEKLEFLRNYLQFTKEYWISKKGLKVFLTCVEVLAENAAYYSFIKKRGNLNCQKEYLPNKIRVDSEMGIAVLKHLVLELEDSTDLPPMTDGLLEGCVDWIQENLRELINDEAINLTGQANKQFKDLDKELEFLVGLILNCSPKNAAELEKLSDIKRRFQTLVGNVGSLVVLSTNEETRGTMSRETTSLGISDWLQKAHLLKDPITDLVLLTNSEGIGRNSPKTDQLGFFNFLIENLRGLKDFSFDGFKAIYEDLVFFRSFIQSMTGKKSIGDGESKELSIKIRFAAYEAEYFINSYVAGACPDRYRSCWLSDFEEKMKLIKATIADFSERKAHENMNIDIVGSSKSPSRVQSLTLLLTTDVMVGFEDEMELLMVRLVGDLKKLDVVSIVGMPGLGKTTLAKKVYEDPSIVDHFQLRAWCCVSQEYNKKELLLTILGSMIELTDLIRRKSDGDLSVMLHKQLTGRRYLIVMDDIWEMDALKDLKRFFPDNSNGSRIMLTSRNRLEDYGDPFQLRVLTHDESWDLLKQKVYRKEECPSELSQVGEEIAGKCRGLPLAIVVVAGILAKAEKTRYLWEQVAANLSLHINGDTTQGQVMAALELSYKHLPDHLKPLFLYLGAFPEDKEIPANKLMWLWIAEGFVHKTDDLVTINLEVQAEQNLMDLIDRSLVMIAERRSNGRIKSCRVHDLLRDMCLRKAKEENFMRQTTVGDYSPYFITYERRLSISLNRSYDGGPFVKCEGILMLSIPPPLSSILFFNLKKTLPISKEENVESVLPNFRLLRILHSESSTVDENLFRDVVNLVHLRYISIRTNWNLIPSSISKLWNLETLIIKGARGEIVVPADIWGMVKLRHLHVNDRADFSSAVVHESSSKLENLETLSTPAICYEEEKNLITRVPNLKKFRCIFVEPRNFYRNYYQLPQLESLNQLESLKLLCYGRMAHSGKFGLPSTLKKLTLSKFRLRWSEIASFQKLPNLEVLKLRGGTVEDAFWDVGDGEFPKLRYLKLESLNIKQWIVSPENFPCLGKLVLQSCKKLEEIPSNVGDFYSLEKIEVLLCSPSAAKSANQILEEQRDNGNELLTVQVHMSS